ncbi:MAG: response regulator [bacterium]|nr:response regulator [bacterium]
MTNHILVIDDEPTIKETLSLVFPEFKFTSASNGKEGIAALRQLTDIAMVFLDYDMPGLNGIQTLCAIKDEFPDTDVIMVTGSPHITAEAIHYGAAGLVEKPIDFDELQELIWDVMDKNRPAPLPNAA